jgi:hypothetical protein
VSDIGTNKITTSNVDTIARGVAQVDEQHAEVTLSATASIGMGVGSKKVKIARGGNTMTDGGERYR